MRQRVKLCFILFSFIARIYAQGKPNFPNENQYVSQYLDSENRIVGGSNVALGQIPSHASLRTLANLHFCGASIVSNRWVISAAHCTINRSQNAINVVVGTVTLNAGGVTYRSVRIIQHPQFSSFTLANDVSLVQTETFLTFTTHIQAINLGIIVLGGGHNVDV